jgi:hypothetical protein
MKKLLFVVSVVMLSGLFFSFTISENPKTVAPEEGGLNMPENIKSIVDNSCYGCHHTDSKNDKGKKKLNFDSFGSEYSNIKSAGKLKEIAEEVSEGNMPPEKFLSHYPEKALSADQKKELSDWAMEAAAQYSGK